MVSFGMKGKILFLLLTLFVALPVIIFVIMAVQGMIIEASDAKPEDIVATNITSTSADIKWTTGKKTQGVIEYGTSANLINRYAPETEDKSEHVVALTLLQPATTYYFQLNINDTIFDNEGTPWTFTTKTKDGSEAASAVKGVMTRILSKDEEATKTAEILGTGNCTGKTCAEIKSMLGKGCGVVDYLKCTTSDSITNTSSLTKTPTTSTIFMLSNICQIEYLQMGDSCMKWSWDSIATKPQNCRDAFDRYIFQCRSKSFTSTNTEDVPTWYYNEALTDIASNSATLNVTPKNGSIVYCQVRAEDAVGGTGHATDWVRVEKTCN